MKKIFLLATVALVATAANAQRVHGAANNAHSSSYVPVVKSIAAATDAELAAKKNVRPAAKAEPKYYRPAGQLYRSPHYMGYDYYNPYVYIRPYADTKIVNKSVNATSYSWSYSKYNKSTGQFDDVTKTTTDLVDMWVNNQEVDAPILIANGTEKFQLSYTRYTDEGSTNEIGIFDCTEDPYAFSGDEAYASPKFFANGVRDNSGTKYGKITYTGARGSATDETDKSGCWAGKNYSGANGMGIYVEKPDYPYALRGVAMWYSRATLTPGNDHVDLTACVYKVKRDADENITFGDLLIKTTASLIPDDTHHGTLIFPFIMVEDGIESEVSLEIDDEILITVTGYDTEKLREFSMEWGADRYDDGYGDMGYIFMNVPNNDPTKAERCTPVSKFFGGTGLGYTAPTIFMDVEYPVVVLNNVADKAEYDFPVAGGEITKTLSGKTVKGIEIYSTKSADDFMVVEQGTDELPSWLSIDLEDVMTSGEYQGLLHADVVAEPLPAGVNYRECVVDFGVTGGHLYYKFTQGDKTAPVTKPGDVNNDGSVDIKDLNIVINIVLGQDSAAKYDGRADVNGDSRVDIVDVNAIINLILG